VAGPRLRIGPATYFTGGDGFFRAASVSFPYDLVIEEPSSCAFIGLRTADPIVTLDRERGLDALAAITGRAPWEPSVQTVAIVTGTGIESIEHFVRDGTGAYLLFPHWAGRDVRPRVSLFVLTTRSATELRFQKYFTSTFSIEDGGRYVVDAGASHFAPVQFRMVEVIATYSPSIRAAQARLEIPSDPYLGFFLSARLLGPSGTRTMLEVPAVPGLPLRLIVSGYSEVGSTFRTIELDRRGSPIAIDLRPPVSLVEPAEEAQVPWSGAAFEWSDHRGGVYELALEVANQPPMVIYTALSRIPFDALPFDVLTAPGVRCSWRVATLTAARSVDDLVAPPGVVALKSAATARSEYRSFVTTTASSP
jgi:hypothetical protein